MNYATPYDPVELQARDSERRARNQSYAFAVADTAIKLHSTLERSKGEYSIAAQRRLLDLCNALIDLIDDGDAMACRETIMWDLNCDERGEPLGRERH